MKLRKGLPHGMMYVDERLRAVVDKMHDLDDRDIRELDAFIDYLRKGPDVPPEDQVERDSTRMYDFMNGGLEKD